jgi:hypothetical protein
MLNSTSKYNLLNPQSIATVIFQGSSYQKLCNEDLVRNIGGTLFKKAY